MLGLVVLLAAVTGLDAQVVRQLHREAECQAGWTVKILHKYGDVVAVGKPSEGLVVTAEARVGGADEQSKQAFAEGIDISIADWAETLFVSVLYPSLPEPSEALSYEVDVRLLMPAAARLDASNSFGDLVARDLEGGCRLANRFGHVEVEGCRDCEVTGRHGDVLVTATRGGLQVDNHYGSVFLDGVGGNVRVANSYGNVEGSGLSGRVLLENVMGNIATRRARGQLVVASRCGEVDAWVEDTGLAEMAVRAHLGRVRLNLARMMPFQLGGRTTEGLIEVGLPFRVLEKGPTRWVTGHTGTGGPRIELNGAWADFYVGTDTLPGTTPEQDAGQPAGDGR